jgi:putative endonuclease
MTVEPWFVYVLECERGKLYTGITNNVQQRFDKHAAGKGARFTKLNKPLRILAFNLYPSKSDAAKVEFRLKQSPREIKLKWVEYFQQRCVAVESASSHAPSGVEKD